MNRSDHTRYFPVTVSKFVIMSIITLGFYELYWFYKNWKHIKRRDDSDIWPIPRAIFSPIFCYSLSEDVNKHSEPGSTALNSVPIALAYFVIVATWRAPDPYWLVSVISFLPLIPIVSAINAMNQTSDSDLAHNSRWRLRHVPLFLIVGPFAVFSIGATVGYFPNTRVVEGAELWQKDIRFLRENELIDHDEEVLYFYSTGLFSIKDDGNILTDRRVVSYWTDYDSGERNYEYAYFFELEEINVEGNTNFLEDTRVIVARPDGSYFPLLLSSEGGKDTVFVAALRAKQRSGVSLTP